LVVVWIIERIAEIALGGIILLVTLLAVGELDFDASTMVEEYRRNLLYIAYFYSFSAYGVSCVIFCLLFRSTSPWIAASVFGAAFLTHSGLFLAANGFAEGLFLIPGFVVGALVAALVNFAGTRSSSGR
jgi:hypothetical protein